MCPRSLRRGHTIRFRQRLASTAQCRAARGLRRPPPRCAGCSTRRPAAVGCFDAALRVVYANTAFTMTTGAAGRAHARGRAAGGRGARDARGHGRAAAGAARRRAADADLRHAVHARRRADRDGARRRRARGARACSPRSSRRCGASRRSSPPRPSPRRVFQAVAEEAGRLLHARSAATIRYEGELRADRRALGRRRPRRLRGRHARCRWPTATG